VSERRCQFCGRELIGKRLGAEYCDSSCRADASRLRHGTLDDRRQTLTNAAGVGSRGGNIRTVEDARTLQSVHKPEWTERIRRHIGRTLITFGAFHADDLQPLEVPEIHSAIVGSQIASYVNRRLMVKVGERRCIHKAANGRKAAIYEITTKGRAELAGLDTENREGTAGSDSPASSPAPSTGRSRQPDGLPRGARSSLGVESGEVGAGQSMGKRDQGRSGLSSPSAGMDPPENASVAQGLEHRSFKAKAAGSNPVGRTTDDLLDQEPVHLTKTSPYAVENEYA
jgi:hypothetical protein